jgi:predicted acylesterase/phospholipase RssA
LRPLAARIAGRSIGVVMAGGGARSFAHIGVLQEFAAAGVLVDRAAGTSAGSIIAALHALGHDAETIHAICYEEFVRHRPFSDYTVPTVSLAKGHRVQQAVHRHFGDVQIEELPLQLRCASTDLRSRKSYAHRTGSVADAVLASISLPVLFPPRRYEDRLLVDGGILDNLPVGLLTERDEGPLVAVNISMGGSERPPGLGATAASPTRPQRVPSLGETLLRTMFIGSGGAVEAARDAGAVVVTPATLGVGLLEFHQLDRMVEAGREAGRAVLDQSGDLLGAQ